MSSANYQIIQDRDKRYDGRFYFAVKTTGIVCKPSCPASRPLEKNITFYETLEEALADGFRPCKHCKPEQLEGSALTTAVALFDQMTVSDVAGTLGISERQLRRLTKDHIGMSPHEIVQARRIMEAKRLLTQTTLSIVDIAFSVGFESLRQYNDIFKRETTYTPRDYRRAYTRNATSLAEPIDITLRLPFKKPLDWQPLRRALLAHMVPGLEQVDTTKDTLTRLIQTSYGYVKTTLGLTEPKDAVHLTLQVTNMEQASEIARIIKRVLDLDHDPARTSSLKDDPLLSPLILRHPGLRICGMFDPYELLINTIIGQQVSVPAARTFSERLIRKYGTQQDGLYTYPDATTLAKVDPMDIYQATKINHTKITTIQAVCGLLASGFDLAAITKSDEARQQLLSIKGIGPWTVEYVILRGFGDPDGFPADDLFIKRLLGAKTGKEAERLAEKWRPYRGYAAMYIWTKGTYE